MTNLTTYHCEEQLDGTIQCTPAKEKALCPSDAATCSGVAPNLVQAGDLWLMEDEDAYHPDKMEYSLLIQCANAEQVREAMKTGKIEFTVFAHYPQNAGVLAHGDKELTDQ